MESVLCCAGVRLHTVCSFFFSIHDSGGIDKLSMAVLPMAGVPQQEESAVAATP